MGISSAGIGSGLDVNAIVTSLMSVESKPLTAVKTQKTDYQSQLSAYGTLKSSLSTFQTAVSALSTASKFNAQTVTSANTSVFTATANGSATVGDYAVTVTQVAKSQKLASAGFANVTDTVTNGALSINFGTYVIDPLAIPPATHTFTAGAKSTVNITIDSTNNTLAGVRDAINAANASVSASIVNNGTNNQLVITSKDTGEINSMQISGIPELAYDLSTVSSSMTETQQAKNALLNVDGIPIVKSSNTISDVISGVTLNLIKDSGGSGVNLGVASNVDAVKESVTAFVDAYNKLDTTMRSLTKYDSTGKSSGVLLGDGTARSVMNQIRSVMNKAIGTGGTLTTLSQIGVGFKRDGQLALDTTKLSTALALNFTEVATLFTRSGKATDSQITYVDSTSKTQAGVYSILISQLGSGLVNAVGNINGVPATGSGNTLRGAVGNASEGLRINLGNAAIPLLPSDAPTINFTIGYAAQLDTIVTNLLSDEGILTSKTDGISSSISRLDKQSDAINVRLAAIEARYRAQFTRLDTMLSSMSSTSSFLTQQLAALNANK